MPIIRSIGRKAPGVRLLHAGIYLVLILGGLSMVYPFLTMVSGSMKSAVDLRELDIVPRFLFDDLVLYRKHLEGLFNESLDAMNMAYNDSARAFDDVPFPAQANHELVEEWHRFLDESGLPHHSRALGYVSANVSRALPLNLRAFKRRMAALHGSDIGHVNRALGSEFEDWNAFYLIAEDYLPRRNMPLDTPFSAAVAEFKDQQPRAFQYHFSPEGFYRKLFLMSQYSRDVAEYNRTHGTAFESYEQIHLPRRAPMAGLERTDWEEFVRHSLSLLWLRVDLSAADAYREFLKAKYGGIDTVNRRHGTSYRWFHQVPLPAEPPVGGMALSDWAAFIAGWQDPVSGRLLTAPAEALRIHSLDFLFRDFLLARHGGLEGVNRALNTAYPDELDILPPQREAHYLAFLDLRRALRLEFAARNYITVIDYMVLHGRGLLNTAIYCTLAVLLALIVNPLAAYAMSRYRMPATYRILLFLMLTMAFPPMVTQIPVFLMLRRLGLLNTFAALVLPGMANGYAIFLLKGFFDSLPRELYESAALDGASEWTMFWQITMSLSKPILSVVALQAFTVAYSNFMFALLICQDSKMWTLMVWLYQLQQTSGQGVIYASLIVAALPTFIIFALCQKVIMRGIVVPVEQ